MDVPRTAVAAARTLVGLAYDFGHGSGVPGHPTRAAEPGDPEVLDTATAWEAVSRNWAPGIAAHRHQVRQEQAIRRGVDISLPPVVVTLPGGYLPQSWTWVMGMDGADQARQVLVQDGYDPDGYGLVATGPVPRPRKRPGLAVWQWRDPRPSPAGAHQVTVAVLGARLAADQLDAWTPELKPRPEADQAKAEAAAYRAFADQAEARLPDTFDWLAALDDFVAAPAFTSVPVTLRGSAYLGTD